MHLPVSLILLFLCFLGLGQFQICTHPLHFLAFLKIREKVWLKVKCIIVDLINPLLLRLSEHMSFPLREIMALFLSVVFVADYVMSHFVLKLVKTSVELSEADDTEAISKEVRLLLSDRSVFHRRFAEAYPEVIYRTERIAARMEEIRAETERLR